MATEITLLKKNSFVFSNGLKVGINAVPLYSIMHRAHTDEVIDESLHHVEGTTVW